MLKHLDRFEAYVCAAIFLAMTALGFANVAVRYLTSYSFAATQELLLAGFLLLTVFGGAAAARHGEHLAVTFFADLLPARAGWVVRALSGALSVLLLALAAWYCWGLVSHQYRSGVTSSGLQIPAWYYSAGLPLGFLLIALRMAQRTLSDLRGDAPEGTPHG
ncbi:TRAP transporter small permease [Jannaschia rubra]|uniref:TRAP transporter small permease n=1 Tax=Jannaschia rubra TaxID=282197 RepID=UPI002492FDD8|nr:TRAP transporter small permease [Jannaschia rubra]